MAVGEGQGPALGRASTQLVGRWLASERALVKARCWLGAGSSGALDMRRVVRTIARGTCLDSDSDSDLARLGSARLGSARLGSARLGSARLDLAWLDLAWLGLAHYADDG